MAETLGDAFPVIQLEGGPIELLRLAGWELGIGGAQTISPVGQTVGIQLFNPAGSGKIVIPTTLHMNFSSAGFVFAGVTDVALATATVGRQRDTREGVAARTVATIRHGNAPAVPIGAARIRVVNAVDLELSDSDGLAVLAPGTAFTVVSNATNQTVNSGWWWRERTAEPSELSF